jgi:hypothetical protein
MAGHWRSLTNCTTTNCCRYLERGSGIVYNSCVPQVLSELARRSRDLSPSDSAAARPPRLASADKQRTRSGQVAQVVERSPEKAGVGGSTPSLATMFSNT